MQQIAEQKMLVKIALYLKTFPLKTSKYYKKSGSYENIFLKNLHKCPIITFGKTCKTINVLFV